MGSGVDSAGTGDSVPGVKAAGVKKMDQYIRFHGVVLS
jgi:hypothetical protein